MQLSQNLSVKGMGALGKSQRSQNWGRIFISFKAGQGYINSGDESTINRRLRGKWNLVVQTILAGKETRQ